MYALCVSGAVNTHVFFFGGFFLSFFFNAPYIHFHSLTDSLTHSFVHSP